MIKHIAFTLFIGSLLLTIFGCHRNENDILSEENIIDIDSGKFLALVDNSKWHPVKHTATYLPQHNQLYILASDDNSRASSNASLSGGIDLDPVNPLKKYLLETNSDNAFKINYNGAFFSDNNMADAGGTFTLTKFDTVNKKISGILQFTGYDRYRKAKVKFTSTIIDDIPLKIDTSNYTVNNASCTVQAATTSYWETKNVYASIDCMSGKEETLYIRISSMVKMYVSGKDLLFIIPLKNTIGKYQIYPGLPPYIYCGDNRMTSDFCSYNYQNKYYATSGELNIINVDTALRKLNATFNVQYRDTTSKGETVQISNGTINLNTWIRFGEPR